MIIGEEGNYDVQGRDPVNVMDFEVTVDGKQVEPSVEIRATRFGVDVTDVLKRYDVPPTMIASGEEEGNALNDRLDDLPQPARTELERYGAIDWNTTFGAENKPLANAHWDTHIAYYWFQTFPAGRSIEVTHRYKPVPRQFLLHQGGSCRARDKQALLHGPGLHERGGKGAEAIRRRTCFRASS